MSLSLAPEKQEAGPHGPASCFSIILNSTERNPGSLNIIAAVSTVFLKLGLLSFDGPIATRSIAEVNVTVVSILAAALYDPIWGSSVTTILDIFIALVGFAVLYVWRLSPLIVVLWCVFASILAASFW